MPLGFNAFKCSFKKPWKQVEKPFPAFWNFFVKLTVLTTTKLVNCKQTADEMSTNVYSKQGRILFVLATCHCCDRNFHLFHCHHNASIDKVTSSLLGLEWTKSSNKVPSGPFRSLQVPSGPIRSLQVPSGTFRSLQVPIRFPSGSFNWKMFGLFWKMLEEQNDFVAHFTTILLPLLLLINKGPLYLWMPLQDCSWVLT